MFEQQDNSSYVNFYVEKDFPEHQEQDIDQYSNYLHKVIQRVGHLLHCYICYTKFSVDFSKFSPNNNFSLKFAKNNLYYLLYCFDQVIYDNLHCLFHHHLDSYQHGGRGC